MSKYSLYVVVGSYARAVVKARSEQEALDAVCGDDYGLGDRDCSAHLVDLKPGVQVVSVYAE